MQRLSAKIEILTSVLPALCELLPEGELGLVLRRP
jgi:hypothetical protein